MFSKRASHTRSYLIFLRVLVIGCISLTTRAEGIEIRQIVPCGLIPGQTNEVIFSGEQLSTATTLWTSFSSTSIRQTDSRDGQARFSVFVPASVGVEIGAVQLIGSNGISNYKLILIDPLARQTSEGEHHSLETSRLIKPPVAIDSTLKNEASDYYAFDATAGEQLSIETVGHRLGASVDTVVRLLDDQKRELVFCEDDVLGERDSRFQFTAPQSGRFYLDVHDVGYQGGSQYDYRLRIGSFPLLSFTYPFGVEAGHRGKVELHGPAIPGSASATIAPQRIEKSNGWLSLTNAFAPYLVDPYREVTEAEPNDSIKTANPGAIPGVLNGKFESAADADFFAFEAARTERIDFQAESRSMGSPCDVVLKILDNKGGVLAESNPTDPGEGAVGHSFDESGRYYLEVTELTSQHGPSLVYRVKADSFEPGFTLSLETERLAVPAGSEAVVKVAANRAGYDGPIRISCVGLKTSFAAAETVIPQGKKEMELKIKVSATPGDFAHFKIIGTPVETSKASTIATTRTSLKKDFPMMLYPPRFLDGLITISATEPKH